MSVVALPARRSGRVTRSPRHTFQIAHQPFVITPFCLAPVLPGETMKSGMLQVRAVTDPIKNPLVGWHLEHYFFYVKHRDLSIRDDLAEMMLDPDKDLSGHYGAADTNTYHNGQGIDWMKRCYNRVVETYFRDEGESLNPLRHGLSVCAINFDFVGQNLTNAADFEGFADVEIPVNPGDPGEGDETVSAIEVDAAMRMFQFQRANGMTEMSYEDWLATYGVYSPPEENHKPELLRYVRDWQYPSNTVDATGAVNSAVSWAIAERMDKDRFFREPGFIIGVSVARPKVYLNRQNSAASQLLQDAVAWLPAILRDDPWTSLRHLAQGEGPFEVMDDAGGYWLDIKDLFIYGDQFVNFELGDTNSVVSLPTAAGGVHYPTGGDMDAFFVRGLNVRQDGIVQLTIAGALQDTTPDMRKL